MQIRIRAALIASLTLIASQMAVTPVGAAVAQKVVIIVGPTGGQTTDYRQRGDSYAVTAEAAGATVVKVYSPKATWANVKAAVNGANIVIYIGHGNGYPNPYWPNGPEPTDRDNGWGLNKTTSGADADDSSHLVYCGEKALMGTLTSASAAQWAYCGGSTNTDGITPAPNWVMIYSNACYAPGASEGSDTPATETKALQRVRNYSYPALMLGAGAYYATDFGANGIVDNILRHPNMSFAEIAELANGYDLSVQRHFDHPDLAGKRIWIQNTGAPTSGTYKLAYAGRLGLTPSGTTVAYIEPTPGPSGPVTYDPPVKMTFLKATHTGYQLNSAGAVTAQKTYTLAATSSAYTSQRSSFASQSGTWFYISSGLWSGYWIRQSSVMYLQSAPVAEPPGANAAYSPARNLTFLKGTHTGYQFSGTGAMTAMKTYTLAANSSAFTSQRAAVTNQSGSFYFVTTGVWTGYWVRASDVVYLP